MIGYLKGNVLSCTENTVLLEVNGVGYELVCSGAAFARLASGGQGEAYTYLQVREDGVTLFGFVSPEEKNMFLKLISVSGVGPRMGIAILSGMSIGELAVAIASSDVKGLCSVKGLGKKTAERIILELREKVADTPVQPAKAGDVPAQAPSGGAEEDAVVGLMSLGYTRAESARAVRAAAERGAVGVEEIILSALKSM